MKKIITILLTLTMLCGILCACGKPAEKPQTAAKFSIVTTIFPEYDWVRNLLGDAASDFDLTILLDSGADLHNYEPSATDVVTVSGCDMFIYVGGESDDWADDVLAQATNKDMIVIDLMEVLGDRVKTEEIKEGMEAEEEEGSEEEEEPETDEHVWLSLKNAAFLCEYIAGKLGELAPETKAAIDANAAAYVAQLNTLDAEYQAAADGAAVKTLLFGDRFPFRYMTDDYGLDYYAAFVGCSAESEASFETIAFLANKVDELGLRAIMQIETADGTIAETIKNTTETKDQTIYTLDSLQSTTAEDIAAGKTYLDTMRANLTVLKDALK